MDRGRWTTLIETFALRTGWQVEDVVSTTLRSYEGVLYGELAENGPARWVLHVGQVGTHRRWSGLQYCSACLATDIEPHFRLSWRLAFHVWCVRHRMRLRDRCVACAGLVALHRIDVGRPVHGRRSPFLFCSLCGHDRRSDPTVEVPFEAEPALSLQVQMLRTLDEGAAPVGDQQIHSLPYFAGMAMLWSFLDDQERAAGVWADDLRLVPPLSSPPQASRFGSIERLSVEERALLLRACAQLLQNGVSGLVQTLSRAGLSSDKLLRYSGRERGYPPFWLWEPVRLGLDKSMYVPSLDEIDAAIAFLLRQTDGGYLKIRDVCAFIGMRTNHSARVAARMHRKGVVRTRRPDPRSPHA